MPRNPDKRQCQRPGCHNWAMRGYYHCRPHLDKQLGPRGAGAPPGNLNALKTGTDASPYSRSELAELAYDLARNPERFEEAIGRLVNDLHRRSGADPLIPRTLKTLRALAAVLKPLIDHHASALFIAEMDDLLARLPPSAAPDLERRFWEGSVRFPPAERLITLRKARRDHRARRAREQLAGSGESQE